ncbi:MAG: alpha/beta hydrolase [Planctomycetota bacterium]|nr:MAG: alpha/beta hydrolase [Planctomycetota bacterium]
MRTLSCTQPPPNRQRPCQPATAAPAYAIIRPPSSPGPRPAACGLTPPRLPRRHAVSAPQTITVEPTPQTPAATATDWRPLYPFASRWLLVERRRLHYLDENPAGAERTLLFVHGNPTWSFHFRRLIVRFRGEYRCVAPDHLGCGLSDPQPRPLRLADHIANIVRIVEDLDLRRVTLVAQDWGGAIGLGALLAAGDRFERIVLFNTGAFRPWFIPFRIRACRWPVVGRLAVQGANAFSRAALTMTLARSRLAPAVAAGYLAPYNCWRRRAAVYQFVRDIPLNAQHPTWRTLEHIERRLPELREMPKLLVWGERDWCFTTECLDRFLAAWPSAETCRLADVGHWVVEDAPEEAEHAMADFLTRT